MIYLQIINCCKINFLDNKIPFCLGNIIKDDNHGESIGLKFIRRGSELFQAIPESVSELFRTNLKNVSYFIWWKTVKNSSDLIRFNQRHQSELIRTKFLIRINPSSDWIKLDFQLESIHIIPTSDLLGIIQIHTNYIGLIRNDFQPFFIKWDTKRFSDWSGIQDWNSSRANPKFSESLRNVYPNQIAHSNLIGKTL